jgi:hypothetical protein
MEEYEEHIEQIPEHIREAVLRYIKTGIPTGSFLKSVIENNLFESFARADDVNRQALFAIVSYFYNWAPSGCWGSQLKRQAWIEAKRLKRDAQTEPAPVT